MFLSSLSHSSRPSPSNTSDTSVLKKGYCKYDIRRVIKKK